MGEEENPTRHAPVAEGKRSLWKLNRDEQRDLLITLVATFVGGVASIVVGAALVGATIALVKHQEHGRGLADLRFMTVFFTVAIVIVVGVAALVKWLSGSLSPWLIGLIALPSMGMFVALLEWIGIGAGIH